MRAAQIEFQALDAGIGRGSVLFDKVPPAFDVWMSHFDSIRLAPEGFRVTASTDEVPVAALEDGLRRTWEEFR